MELILNVRELPELSNAKADQEQLVKENPFIEVTNKDSYEEAKKRRTALLKGRTGIEKQEKAITKRLNEIKGDVKEFAAELINITKIHEEKQQSSITPYEDKIKEEKARKEREAAKQLEEWNKKAQNILSYTDDILKLTTSEQITRLIQEIEEIEVTEDVYGAYELIASQNKDRVLEQANTVLERLLKEEAEKKEKELQELLQARADYEAYFHQQCDTELKKAEILKLIEDDKQTKLAKLQAIEEAERYREGLLKEAGEFMPMEDVSSMSNLELSEKIKELKSQPDPKEEPQTTDVIVDDVGLLEDWLEEILNVYNNPPKVDSEESKKVVTESLEYLGSSIAEIQDYIQ